MTGVTWFLTLNPTSLLPIIPFIGSCQFFFKCHIQSMWSTADITTPKMDSRQVPYLLLCYEHHTSETPLCKMLHSNYDQLKKVLEPTGQHQVAWVASETLISINWSYFTLSTCSLFSPREHLSALGRWGLLFSTCTLLILATGLYKDHFQYVLLSGLHCIQSSGQYFSLPRFNLFYCLMFSHTLISSFYSRVGSFIFIDFFQLYWLHTQHEV